MAVHRYATEGASSEATAATQAKDAISHGRDVDDEVTRH